MSDSTELMLTEPFIGHTLNNILFVYIENVTEGKHYQRNRQLANRVIIIRVFNSVTLRLWHIQL